MVVLHPHALKPTRLWASKRSMLLDQLSWPSGGAAGASPGAKADNV